MSNSRKKVLQFIVLEIILWSVLMGAHFYMHLTFKEEFSWRYPAFLLLNFLMITLLALFLWNSLKWQRLTKQWNSKSKALFFVNGEKSAHHYTKILLFRISLFFLLVSLAQPVLGVQKVKTSQRNAEIILVMDISNSMNTCDIQENISRLQVVKRGLIEMINNCKGERIGIVLFAQNAFSNLPLTKDYSAAKLFVNETETKMLSNQGTNFKAALDLANESFTKEKNKKAILILTDGENHTEIPSSSLEQLEEKEIYFAAIGVGTAEGGPILQDPDRPELGYMTDNSGKVILSKVDQNLIRKMAKLASGTAVFITSPFPNLSELLTEINRQSKGKVRDLSLEIKSNRYRIPLWIGLIFLLLSFNWSEIYRIVRKTNA